jgi:hypothetical protein
MLLFSNADVSSINCLMKSFASLIGLNGYATITTDSVKLENVPVIVQPGRLELLDWLLRLWSWRLKRK